MHRFILTAVSAATLLVAGQASAAAQVSVSTTDLVYGGFSGSVDVGATGSAATLSWNSAGYFWSGDIALTDASGVILDEIRTNSDDLYQLFAPGSGDAALGTTCANGGSTICVVATGLPQSLYEAVNAMNGGQGICCFDSDIVVTVNGVGGVPEPATWALMLTGFGLAGAALRRRTNVMVAA